MGSPVVVEVPNFRIRTAHTFAYWADRDVQEREWIRHEGIQPSWDTMCNQLDDIDWIDQQESPADSIGGVVATLAEHRRVFAVDECVETLFTVSDEIDCECPESFFNHQLWLHANQLALCALCLIVMDGGCWTEDSVRQTNLVSEYPLRALAAQCLASLADYGADDLEEQPPFRRDFGDATTTLVERCALSNPGSAIGRIYCDGDEIPRLQRLYEAIQRDAPKDDIAALAGHALTAVVRAWAGWNYDGPIDATRSSR